MPVDDKTNMSKGFAFIAYKQPSVRPLELAEHRSIMVQFLFCRHDDCLATQLSFPATPP